MRVSGIIFDFDGTLADTLPVCFAAYRVVFQRYLGRQLSDEETAQYFGPSEEGVIAAAVGQSSEEAVEMYLREYEANHHLCPAPFDGIAETLELLRGAGVRTSLVTGKGPRSLEISFQKMGLRSYFDSVATGGLTRNTKAESISAAVAGWGLEPSEVAYIGDSPSDIQQSKLAGVVPLAAAWSPTLGKGRAALEAMGPEVVFDSPSELVARVGISSTR